LERVLGRSAVEVVARKPRRAVSNQRTSLGKPIERI